MQSIPPRYAPAAQRRRCLWPVLGLSLAPPPAEMLYWESPPHCKASMDFGSPPYLGMFVVQASPPAGDVTGKRGRRDACTTNLAESPDFPGNRKKPLKLFDNSVLNRVESRTYGGEAVCPACNGPGEFLLP